MSFTCPICGRTSHNPHDASERYCDACHGFTEEAPPPGLRWVLFRGGALDQAGRLLSERGLEIGATYERVLSEERYVFDGKEFVLE